MDLVPEASEGDSSSSMSKRNEALAALTSVRHDPLPIAEARPTPPVEAAKPERKTVANSAARVMLYLDPKVKRKVKEIAFYEGRKEHDIYIEALRDYLEKHGHHGLL
jgi:hypothetical protein